MKVLTLKKNKIEAINRKHPWIFSGALVPVAEELNDGEIVAVSTERGNVLCKGIYQSGSIAIRVLTFKDEEINQQFWNTKIQLAKNAREKLHLPSDSTSIFRLVHGEGDGLSGIIIDIYGNNAVIQPHYSGFEYIQTELTQALENTFKDTLTNIILRNPAQSKNAGKYETLKGSLPKEFIALENNIRFKIDLEKGQKTGFFVDQRDNRKLLGELANGKSVLNTFCYNGGFSLSALKGGATKVCSVDVSKSAIEQTKENLQLNGFSADKNPCLAIDTFDFLNKNEEDYDIIVLDPPAFAKHKSARHNAVQGYKRLNALAMQQIKQGGILFTFSCSQVIDNQLFYNTIVAAAIESGRDVKVLYRLSQPADHPVSIYHPEGSYLKGLVLEII